MQKILHDFPAIMDEIFYFAARYDYYFITTTIARYYYYFAARYDYYFLLEVLSNSVPTCDRLLLSFAFHLKALLSNIWCEQGWRLCFLLMLLTPCCMLLTPCCILLTADYLLTADCPLPPTYNALLSVYCLLLSAHCLLLTAAHSLLLTPYSLLLTAAYSLLFTAIRRSSISEKGARRRSSVGTSVREVVGYVQALVLKKKEGEGCEAAQVKEGDAAGDKATNRWKQGSICPLHLPHPTPAQRITVNSLYTPPDSIPSHPAQPNPNSTHPTSPHPVSTHLLHPTPSKPQSNPSPISTPS